jgi:hypothetical protein
MLLSRSMGLPEVEKGAGDSVKILKPVIVG